MRGRWQNKARVSDVYDDIELPYPDAKVAGLQCIGGPCKYKIKENSGVTDAFILEHVATNMKERVGNAAAVILGKALMWYAFAPEGDEDMPHWLYRRIHDAYNLLPVRLPDDENPIEKIPVVITGSEGEVYIDEIPGEGENNGGGNGNTGGNGNNGGGGGGPNALGGLGNRPVREQLLAQHSQISALRRELADMKAILLQQGVDRNRQYQTVNGNVRRTSWSGDSSGKQQQRK
jgi:hypothetical protein